jgi:lipopolysaccharide transport system ATP-binding protein
MAARLGFAIIAHADADIIITDEALAVGDAYFVQKAMRHIHSFLKKGTFLFVSHSVNDVMSLCTHAVWLSEGRPVRVGSARDVCEEYIKYVDQKKSRDYIEQNTELNRVIYQDDSTEIQRIGSEAVETRQITPTKSVSLSGEQLAALRNYYAPKINIFNNDYSRKSLIEIDERGAILDDLFEDAEALGGGKIFSVTLTDEHRIGLTSVLGGEIVCLEIKAIAEKTIKYPILGFQLRNRLGLPVVAENTFLATRSSEVSLYAGQIISAKFHFMMPLVPVGEYMIRTGLADGVEDDNALLDVKNEALLLRCNTSGVRHGMAGLPLIRVDIKCEQMPVEAIENV